MPKFELTLKSGEKRTLKNVLSATVKRELDVPADSLELTLPFSRELAENALKISVYSDGELCFTGKIDEKLSVKSKRAAILRITARSLAAALLDNEAQPLMYLNPSAELIAARHLRPFGITEVIADNQAMTGSLRIDKGMSHWQVVETFCLNKYGSPPFIAAESAYLNGAKSNKTVYFGDGGIPCHEVREHRRPRRLITSVRLMVNKNAGYSSRMGNENPECAFEERVRYVNCLADNSNPDTARRMIDKSNRKSYSLCLGCAGCLLNTIGQAAVFRDRDFGRLDGLRVSSVKYVLNKDGEHSTVSLEKEKF